MLFQSNAGALKRGKASPQQPCSVLKTAYLHLYLLDSSLLLSQPAGYQDCIASRVVRDPNPPPAHRPKSCMSAQPEAMGPGLGCHRCPCPLWFPGWTLELCSRHLVSDTITRWTSDYTISCLQPGPGPGSFWPQLGSVGSPSSPGLPPHGAATPCCTMTLNMEWNVSLLNIIPDLNFKQILK